jgi:hypothetical protein
MAKNRLIINVENIYKRSKILTYLYNQVNFAWQIALSVFVVYLVYFLINGNLNAKMLTPKELGAVQNRSKFFIRDVLIYINTNMIVG